MAVLLIAEHDNASLKPATLNAVTAAKALGGDLVVLVAGQNCRPAAEAAAAIPGVAKVLLADDSAYANRLAENLAKLVVALSGSYSHIDVAQISDISAVESPDTFVRTIYAGNALATVQSADKIKVVTVRMTGFDPA